MSPKHFCGSSDRFRDIKISNFLPSKVDQEVQIFEITPFGGKRQNLQTSYFTILIFANNLNRQTHTQTHRNGKAPGYRRILQFA